MSHRFSNTRRVRDSIRQQAKREWKDLPVNERIQILEQVSKVAWLRQVLGRNEGKEWVLDAPQTSIGPSRVGTTSSKIIWV